MPALIARDGPLEGRRFDVSQEHYIGREDQAITVDDPGVSRRHAALRVSGEVVTIEDMGSLNGTFVNGNRIDAPAMLLHGDVVRVGATSFEFEGSSVPVGATVAMPAPRVEAPDLPFGAYATGNVAGHSRRKVASRQLLPELIAIVAIVFTAVALVLYFGLR